VKRPARAKADDFLRAMTPESAEPPPTAEPEPTIAAQPARIGATPPATRSGLKHIGGYFAPETVEKVAVLRARLNLDNSGLIKLAIDELHARHMAQRAHGDA
jgi:hypothetical protein